MFHIDIIGLFIGLILLISALFFAFKYWLGPVPSIKSSNQQSNFPFRLVHFKISHDTGLPAIHGVQKSLVSCQTPQSSRWPKQTLVPSIKPQESMIYNAINVVRPFFSFYISQLAFKDLFQTNLTTMEIFYMRHQRLAVRSVTFRQALYVWGAWIKGGVNEASGGLSNFQKEKFNNRDTCPMLIIDVHR